MFQRRIMLSLASVVAATFLGCTTIDEQPPEAAKVGVNGTLNMFSMTGETLPQFPQPTTLYDGNFFPDNNNHTFSFYAKLLTEPTLLHLSLYLPNVQPNDRLDLHWPDPYPSKPPTLEIAESSGWILRSGWQATSGTLAVLDTFPFVIRFENVHMVHYSSFGFPPTIWGQRVLASEIPEFILEGQASWNVPPPERKEKLCIRTSATSRTCAPD